MSCPERITSPKACSCLLNHGELCRALDPALREELQGLGRLKSFARGATVVAEGEAPDLVGNVVSGVLRMQKTLPDGRGAIVGLLTPSDMFGRVFSGPAKFSLEAATDVVLCCCRRAALEALLTRRPELEHQFLLNVIDELDASREWIMLMSGHNVTARVATFLLIFARRWPNRGCGRQPAPAGDRVRIPISRTDMAQYLGTRVETLSRTIKSLARGGLISDPEPGLFEIRDPARLIALSGNADHFEDLLQGPDRLRQA